MKNSARSKMPNEWREERREKKDSERSLHLMLVQDAGSALLKGGPVCWFLLPKWIVEFIVGFIGCDSNKDWTNVSLHGIQLVK